MHFSCLASFPDVKTTSIFHPQPKFLAKHHHPLLVSSVQQRKLTNSRLMCFWPELISNYWKLSATHSTAETFGLLSGQVTHQMDSSSVHSLTGPRVRLCVYVCACLWHSTHCKNTVFQDVCVGGWVCMGSRCSARPEKHHMNAVLFTAACSCAVAVVMSVNSLVMPMEDLGGRADSKD